jgi:hypothetical protein
MAAWRFQWERRTSRLGQVDRRATLSLDRATAKVGYPPIVLKKSLKKIHE